MGLVERRLAKAFQDDLYPALHQRIEAAAAHPIAIEVDWASLQTEGYGPLYAEAWAKVFFEPLIGALEAVATDEMGRDALAENLRSVKIRNSGTHGVTFAAGELVLDYEAVANLEDGDQRRKEIQATLERHL